MDGWVEKQIEMGEERERENEGKNIEEKAGTGEQIIKTRNEQNKRMYISMI